MPEVVPTNINAHKVRVAELRAQAAALTGEANQLQEYIDSVEPKPVAKPAEVESAEEPKDTAPKKAAPKKGGK